MREITVFTSNGVRQPITIEHEPERQIRRVLKVAKAFFATNGLPLDEDSVIERIKDGELRTLIYMAEEALSLKGELERLESLL